ncbi:putative regulator PutR for proline utilization, GntR family [Candidatus Burkholderia verschuerenii]|uniref:Putative regulator PutR for proline utilization, GntR family n=1 Tax=Candidatus Burkholderia verschuerenii TaxID=242163 RepID=A0A0L0MH67_9BURK|nr:GntR family transcriptional regulator [Candidatus Burkholderia verschuerenii]KND62037.1 putative regulator PutR for proline utilization, GntR family [Candidatus Burkholderia verschuerenii]
MPTDISPAGASSPGLSFRDAQFEPRQSTSRFIADALRSAIVEGSLLPGEPLRQDAIARQFSVSAIPVREAFRQLESEGWVTIEPNRGAAVSLQSADEAREIYEIRASLESLAIGIALEHHTPETLADAQRLLEAAENEPDPALYVVRNEQFHMSLYAPADRPRLMEMIGQMHRRGERYLRLKLGLPIHKDASDAEHRAILAALAARDIQQAQTLVARHLLATGELIHRFLADAQALAQTTHTKKKRRASSRTTSRQAKQ